MDKYCSIENQGAKVNDYYNEIIQAAGNVDDTWIILEKIHGSNLGINRNGIQSRNKILTREDKFFSLNKIWDTLIDKFQKLTEEEQQSYTIFGELFGGNFDHPDVPRVGVAQVQKGVSYGPDIYFFAFDVKNNGQYLPYPEAIKIFERCGFEYCRILQEGTFAECIAFDVENFASTIPAALGLPAPLRNQWAEGVIIKPKNAEYRTPKGSRIILKKKRSNFEEVVMGKRPAGAPKPVDKNWDTLHNYVTAARLDNILSKDPVEINKSLLPKLSAAMCDDIIESYKREIESANSVDDPLYILLTGNPKDKKLQDLLKKVRGASSKIVLQYIQNNTCE